MEFDQVPSYTYNARHAILGRTIASLKERERIWLCLKD
jgi:hypothetical protein